MARKTVTPAAKKSSARPDNDPVSTTSAIAPLPKKSRQILEDENADLRKQIKQLQGSQKLDVGFVLKPKGQAGRGDGYNLYDEMRLSSTASYNMIRNVVRVIGNLRAKDNARKEIKKLVPVMKYYHRAWPINAFLRQYLGSSAAKYRRDMENLCALNEVPSRQKTAASKTADGDAEDFVGFSSDGSDESDGESEMGDRITATSAKKPSVSKGKNAADKKQAVVKEKSKGTNAADKKQAAVKEKSKGKNVVDKKQAVAKAKRTVTFAEPLTEGAKKTLLMETENNNKTSKKQQLPLLNRTEELENRPARKTRSSQQKDKLIANDNEESGQAVNTKKRKSENDLEHSRPAKQTRKTGKDKVSTAETDWPSACPDEYCDDAFPSLPSKRLAATYGTYLIQKTPFNALLVCVQIQNDQKLPDLHQVALKNKWPIDIDFGSVANRIAKHYTEISGLLTNEIVISTSVVWKTFIRTLSGHAIPLSKFNGLSNQKKFSVVGPVTHCGYYGPRGLEIISAAIYSTIYGKDQMTITGNLQTALADIVENHRDTTIAFAGFWDSADGCLISLTNFIEYVITPHVANLLIQEDLQTSEDNANTHRLRSKNVGDSFQYTDGSDENTVEYETVLPPHLRKILLRHPLPEVFTSPTTVPTPVPTPVSVVTEVSNTLAETAPPTLKIPPRPRPTTRNRKGLAPKQLTMSDFPPPAVKKT